MAGLPPPNYPAAPQAADPADAAGVGGGAGGVPLWEVLHLPLQSPLALPSPCCHGNWGQEAADQMRCILCDQGEELLSCD